MAPHGRNARHVSTRSSALPSSVGRSEPDELASDAGLGAPAPSDEGASSPKAASAFVPGGPAAEAPSQIA